MPRVFHVSDLHLTSAADEQDYSLAVLREVVEQTRSCGADALLICGHLFDASADLDAIASPLRDILADLSCAAFLIPGAGELDGRQSARLQEVIQPIILLQEAPFCLHTVSLRDESLEILAVPHQAGYDDLWRRSLPPRRAKHRIAMVHATILSSPCAPDPVSPASPIDPSLLARFEVSYLALGSVHEKQGVGRFRQGFAAYAGSARVTDRCEVGERTGMLVDLDDTISVTPVPLITAGQYRLYEVAVPLEEADTIAADAWHANDRIEVRAHGVVARDRSIDEVASKARQLWGERVRRLDVDLSAVRRCINREVESVALRYAAGWAACAVRGDEADKREWFRSLDLGLELLCDRHGGGA